MDYTLCKNTNCFMKEHCFRYTAKPNPHWQSYAYFEPEDGSHCSYFIPNNENMFWEIYIDTLSNKTITTTL